MSLNKAAKVYLFTDFENHMSFFETIDIPTYWYVIKVLQKKISQITFS